jgi:Zn-dependent peptidase ImmA (M78 family)
MDDEMRMKLADLGSSPEALAACIIQHYPGLELPVPLELIARAVGIEEIIGQRTASFEGILITNSAKTIGSIAYNEGSRLERRRFTIAHELGHYLLPLHGATAQCVKTDMGVFEPKDANLKREAEANRFAAALLMPRGLFLAAVRRLGEPEVEHIVTLAKNFEVSKEAAVRRYLELCDDPCAVIFSRTGIAGNIYRTTSFPFISLRKELPLPRQCGSVEPNHEVGRISDSFESEPGLWVDDTRRFRGASLYEQYLDQADGRRMTMLTVDGELNDEDDPDTDEDPDDTWTPPKFTR